MQSAKFVLISESGYNPKHDTLLESVLNDGFQYFCAVGKDCELWEEIMDELAVGDGTNIRYITTTSHPGESEGEVIEFAKSLEPGIESVVKIVRI